jgi:S1-C subfamily serine protease
VVSGVGRDIQSITGRTIRDVVQTDAAINPGNSGGPLLDSRGRLIGVNTVIYSPSGASAGVGFAIPVDTVRRVVNMLIRNRGVVVRAGLGVRCAADAQARQLGLPGVLVIDVSAGSAAAKAGVRGTARSERDGTLLLGDVIVAVGSLKTAAVEDLLAAVEEREPGDAVELTLLRDGRQRTVKVTLQRLTDQR